MQGAVGPLCLDLIKGAFDASSLDQSEHLAHLVGQYLDYDVTPEKSAELVEQLFAEFNEQIRTLCVPILKSSVNAYSEDFMLIQISKLVAILKNFDRFRSFMTVDAMVSFAWKNVLAKASDSVIKICNYQHSVSEKNEVRAISLFAYECWLNIPFLGICAIWNISYSKYYYGSYAHQDLLFFAPV